MSRVYQRSRWSGSLTGVACPTRGTADASAPPVVLLEPRRGLSPGGEPGRGSSPEAENRGGGLPEAEDRGGALSEAEDRAGVPGGCRWSRGGAHRGGGPAGGRAGDRGVSVKREPPYAPWALPLEHVFRPRA